MVEHNPPLDFQREPIVPETKLQIQSEVDNEISPKFSVIAVVDDNSNVESGNNSGLRSPDQVVTKPVMPSHAESRPCQVVIRSGRVINRPDRLNLQFSFVSCVDCHENCIGRRKCGILGNIGHVIKIM